MQRRRLRRRKFLGGVGGVLAGMAGCVEYGFEQDGSETTAVKGKGKGQTPSNQHPTGPAVKKTLEGKVVPIAPGLEPSAAIDPDETSTPVGDAVAAIDSTGDQKGFGTVLLPPTLVQEAAPVVPTQFIDFIGWGIHTSEIEFTDLKRDGFRIEHLKDGKFVLLDGFTIGGKSPTKRSDGSAIHFVNDTGVHPKGFDIGHVAFRNWIDPVVHCERGSPFDCVWEHLDFGYDANRGREIVLERGQSLLGTQILYVGAGNATNDTVFYTNFAGAKVNIGFINIGGSAGQAVRIKASSNGHVHIGGINFEPTQPVDNSIVSVQGSASTRLEYVQNTNSEVRSMVRLDYNNGNNVVGRLHNNGTVRTGKIEVVNDSARPSYYFGPSSDIVTQSNASAQVVAFADLQNGVDLSQYSNASPSDLASREFAVDTNVDGTGDGALVYRDETGTLYRWNADETQSPD